MKQLFHSSWDLIFQNKKSSKEKGKALGKQALFFQENSTDTNYADLILANDICKNYNLPGMSWLYIPDADFYQLLVKVAEEKYKSVPDENFVLPGFDEILFALNEMSSTSNELKFSILQTLQSYNLKWEKNPKGESERTENEARKILHLLDLFNERKIPPELWIDLVPECIFVAAAAMKAHLSSEELRDYQTALLLGKIPVREALPELRTFLTQRNARIEELMKDSHLAHLLTRPLN